MSIVVHFRSILYWTNMSWSWLLLVVLGPIQWTAKRWHNIQRSGLRESPVKKYLPRWICQGSGGKKVSSAWIRIPLIREIITGVSFALIHVFLFQEIDLMQVLRDMLKCKSIVVSVTPLRTLFWCYYVWVWLFLFFRSGGNFVVHQVDVHFITGWY